MQLSMCLTSTGLISPWALSGQSYDSLNKSEITWQILMFPWSSWMTSEFFFNCICHLHSLGWSSLSLLNLLIKRHLWILCLIRVVRNAKDVFKVTTTQNDARTGQKGTISKIVLPTVTLLIHFPAIKWWSMFRTSSQCCQPNTSFKYSEWQN